MLEGYCNNMWWVVVIFWIYFEGKTNRSCKCQYWTIYYAWYYYLEIKKKKKSAHTQFIDLSQTGVFFPMGKMYSTKYIDWISKIWQRGKVGNFTLPSIYLFHIKSYLFTGISNGCQDYVITQCVILTNLETILCHCMIQRQ